MMVIKVRSLTFQFEVSHKRRQQFKAMSDNGLILMLCSYWKTVDEG